MKLEIISNDLLVEFKTTVGEMDISILNFSESAVESVDSFDFYNAVSSVYSSKIEGEEIDFDSFYKYKFLNSKYKKEYTKRTEDLYNAYGLVKNNMLGFEGVMQAHKLLTKHLLPESERGTLRENAMFVLDSDDRIAYVAATAEIVKTEANKLFNDITMLLKEKLTTTEVFYYASMIHLVFVKIHPLQDGNGRIARLIEKWFLVSKLGDKAHGVPLEKNYFLHLSSYYANLKKLGNQYEIVDYSKGIDFLLMTVQGIELDKKD